ncbi:Mdm33 family-domain-containing protein, partial [Pterulicium gracile]
MNTRAVFLPAHLSPYARAVFSPASQRYWQASSSRARPSSSHSGRGKDDMSNEQEAQKAESSSSFTPGSTGVPYEENLSAYAQAAASSSPYPSSSTSSPHSLAEKLHTPTPWENPVSTPPVLPDGTPLTPEEIEALYKSYNAGPELTGTSSRLEQDDHVLTSLASLRSQPSSSQTESDSNRLSGESTESVPTNVNAERTTPDTTPPSSEPPTPNTPPWTFPRRFNQRDAQDLINRQLSQINELRSQLNTWITRASLLARQRAEDLTTLAQTRLSQLGRNLNEMTGYEEIDKLKAQVVEQEAKIAEVRASARSAKTSYTTAVTTLQSSQRQLADLLHRKPSWTSSDVLTFTHLVRADHSAEQALLSAKSTLDQSDAVLEREFDELMRRILGRYHEEQVWSDKIRRASTYGQMVVLGVNVLVFLGAIVVVEPWKRRKLAGTFERKVEVIREEGKRGLEEAVIEIKGLLEG